MKAYLYKKLYRQRQPLTQSLLRTKNLYNIQINKLINKKWIINKMRRLLIKFLVKNKALNLSYAISWVTKSREAKAGPQGGPQLKPHRQEKRSYPLTRLHH